MQQKLTEHSLNWEGTNTEITILVFVMLRFKKEKKLSIPCGSENFYKVELTDTQVLTVTVELQSDILR